MLHHGITADLLKGLQQSGKNNSTRKVIPSSCQNKFYLTILMHHLFLVIKLIIICIHYFLSCFFCKWRPPKRQVTKHPLFPILKTVWLYSLYFLFENTFLYGFKSFVFTLSLLGVINCQYLGRHQSYWSVLDPIKRLRFTVGKRSYMEITGVSW